MQARLDEEEFGELDDEPAAAAAEETKGEVVSTNVNSIANVTTASAASSSYPTSLPTERKKAARKTAVKADTSPKPAEMSNTEVAPIPATAASEAKKSAEPTDKTEKAVVVALKPPTSAKEQASEEMKRKRAERFNIPVVSSNPPKEKELGKKGTKEPTSSKRKKTEKAEEPKVLPLEEIEKLLQRAEKYGSADKARIDELKAMKRTYRFS